MTSSNKKKLLNGIMAVALLVLAGSAYIARERAQAQSSYEILSEQRALQLQYDDMLDETLSAEASGQAGLSGSDTEPAQTNSVYAYKDNPNAEWLSLNPDFMGWLKISGTTIDYPFVSSKDNKDYLKRDFNGNYSEAGTLFLDYRNLGNFNDRHTLIYGHNMKNKTMFHNLTYYRDPDFFSRHLTIELSGLYETRTYNIFSVYEISADDYAFTLNFSSDDEYLTYLSELENASLHRQDLELTADQRLLTLVTCSYGVNNGRTIVHALETVND